MFKGTEIIKAGAGMPVKDTASRLMGEMLSRPRIYGWHVDPSISDPSQAITYLADARGKTPAAMGASTFSYGGWEKAFFMPKPCMLRYDGTVAYYLDPNDYTKKADGTPSDVANASFEGNAMMEWPLIWYKFEAGEAEGEGSFYCSDRQVDESYHCWCNINANDEIIPHFYTAIYNGTGTAKLRSLSGVQLTSANGNGDTTVSVDISKAAANGTGWYIETLSVRSLINSLLILIGKNLNCSEVFGNGITGTGVQETRNNKENYYTGTCNDKGLFWGSLSSHTQPVKVFGMENWWGCVFRRVAGLLHDSGTQRYYVKLTSGRSDGTTVDGYSFSSHTGYITLDIPVSYTAGGYIRTMRFSQYGFYPLVLSGNASDNYWHSWWAVFSDSGHPIMNSLAGGMVTGRASAFEIDFTSEEASSYTLSSCLTFRP